MTDQEKVREISRVKNKEGFTIFEFLELTEKYKLAFISYTEIIISKYGRIYLAFPSHLEKMIDIVAEKENKTNKEIKLEIPIYCASAHYLIDKYNFVSIWYNEGMASLEGYNRYQKRVVKMLKQARLLSINFNMYYTREYQLHLKREAMIKEDLKNNEYMV